MRILARRDAIRNAFATALAAEMLAATCRDADIYRRMIDYCDTAFK